GATWLGVAHPASALALARADLDAQILTWLFEPHTARIVLPEVLASGVDVSVGSPEMLALVSEAAREAERRARGHLTTDNGMGRNGVLPWQIRELGAAMWEDEFIQVAGAWTHLPTADDPEDPATDQQVELFDSAVAA